MHMDILVPKIGELIGKYVYVIYVYLFKYKFVYIMNICLYEHHIRYNVIN